ncbi:MAG: hypothetical protein EBZ49_16145, partial [Proteobacteria bacterium]|nr:hypothetical protein [Pseudomonadota bacterium]
INESATNSACTLKLHDPRRSQVTPKFSKTASLTYRKLCAKTSKRLKKQINTDIWGVNSG